MQKSKNEAVQFFLDEIEGVDQEKFEILQMLRRIVFVQNPKVTERIMYGGIMFRLEEDFGGVYVRKNHISFEFGFGANMDDPSEILEGKGKFRRHLKIRSISDIEVKKVGFL